MGKRWLTLLSNLGIEPNTGKSIWLSLAAAYGANGRFYHNLSHIEEMLDVAEQLRDVAEDFTAVQLAIWFHDVIYDPRRSDNEAQSAAHAVQIFHPLGVSGAMLSKVSDLILATKSHQTAVNDSDYFVLLDADLAILGAGPKQYQAYAQAIRREYSFVPDAAYRVGRTAVLQRFLARSPFYFTKWMRQNREDAVIRNLTWEIERLESTPS